MWAKVFEILGCLPYVPFIYGYVPCMVIKVQIIFWFLLKNKQVKLQ